MSSREVKINYGYWLSRRAQSNI